MKMQLCGAHLLVAAAACAAGLADADTVCVENGDRISGTVQQTQNGVLRVDTPYAGTIEIQQDAVTCIEREPPKPEAVAEVAQAEQKPETTRWSGTVDTAFSWRSGNTDTTDFTLASAAVRTGERNTLTLSGSAAYGKADDVLNTRRYLSEAKWQYYLSECCYVFLLGGAERDDGRKLESRIHVATGVGRDFIKNDRRTLSADIGLDHAWERWGPFTPQEKDATKDQRRSAAWNRLTRWLGEVAAGKAPFSSAQFRTVADALLDLRDPLRQDETRSEEILNVRIATHYKQPLFGKSKLSEALIVLPSTEESGEFRLTSELVFTTPLTENLQLKTSLRNEYDSSAEENSGVDAWDHTLLTGIGYEF